jgi:Histone deacetylase complex, SIN3 component
MFCFFHDPNEYKLLNFLVTYFEFVCCTGELTVATANSPPASSTPPMGGGEGSPRESRGQSSTLSPSPPVVVASSAASSSSVDVVPTSRTVVTSPFSVSREYAFTHIHTQPGQVSTGIPEILQRK